MKTPKFVLLLMLMLTGMVMTGCGKADEVYLTADQLNGIFAMNKGETLVIELPANPSTGYAWEVENLDTTIFEQIGDIEFVQESKEEPVVGAPETQIIRLKAVASGQTTLNIIYHRSFEPAVPPLETKWLDVDVK